ncbi:MAG TPA: hypothetical protein DCQ98_17345 [Planctomycetaceae bacterium]|nr:hypothetical protein [Planctomycetaceae bacterium]
MRFDGAAAGLVHDLAAWEEERDGRSTGLSSERSPGHVKSGVGGAAAKRSRAPPDRRSPRSVYEADVARHRTATSRGRAGPSRQQHLEKSAAAAY